MSLVALHGLWSPQGRLCVFGEDSERPRKARRAATSTATATSTRPRVHPFAAASERLRDALAQACAAIGPALGDLPITTLVVRLPGSVDGPSPSPQLGGGAPRGRPTLRPWKVPALELDPAAALDLLLALPPGHVPGVAVGDSLRYLARAAELTLELVARGRVLPALLEEPTGRAARAWPVTTPGAGARTRSRAGVPRYVARWRPVPAAGDAPRLRALAAAMPPLLRAGAGADVPEPSALLRDFVEQVADAAVRESLGRRSLRPPRRGRRPTVADPTADATAAWLDALVASDPAVAAPVDAGAGELAKLAAQLDEWRRQARGSAQPVRACFRLEPPPDDTDAPWRVELLLQPADDPSLLVPAAEVWKAGRALELLESRVDLPQERLLADLGRAARLWPDLERALAVARPERAELDPAGALGFLRDAAPVLEQAGFGVLLPAWWTSRRNRLGVRLKARSAAPKAATEGRLGMDALCEYRFELALGDERMTDRELRELARLKQPLVRVRGQWVVLGEEEVEAALALLQQPAAAPAHMPVADVLRAGLGLDDLGLGLPVVGIEADGPLGELLRGDADRRLEAVALPAGFAATLRPYQERGLAWLAFLDRLGLGGCLADDMGLGKTVQLLALLAAERDQAAAGRKRGRKKRLPPTLVVCPMSVVGNWQREAERFAPALVVHVHHGRERLKGDDLARAVRDADLVITTYALAARDQAALAAVEWGRVALDEAQNVKNSEARQTRAVRALPAGRRVALTGTPVENRLAELWSIMEFLNPGLLGKAAVFHRRFAVPIERYGDDDAAALLRRITGPFILRRLKTDPTVISDLPEKLEMTTFCNLTREQASLYQAVVDDMLARIEESEGIERRGLVLATMVKLKQVCNHPAHFLGDGSHLDGRSGKLARLEELLEEVLAEGDRALCFTQFAAMGELLRQRLRERFGCEVAYLHGGTSKRARDEMVARFQAEDGPPVFLLSLKAGGTGLNLTAANHVIHFDRWWNPAVEDQATDRAFRIGQRRNVQVRKLVCAGTLEERIAEVIESKRALAERIVGTGEQWLTELSTEDLRDVVTLSADAVVE